MKRESPDFSRGGCQRYHWYYVNNTGDLIEDSDHNQQGIDVSWAFHENEDFIRTHAPRHFLDSLVNQLEQGLDEGFDADQWRSLAETYT